MSQKLVTVIRVNYPSLVVCLFQFCFLVRHGEYTKCICGDKMLHTRRSLYHILTWSAVLVEWDHKQVAWGLGLQKRIKTSLWPGDKNPMRRIRTSQWPGDLNVAWGLGRHERIRTSQPGDLDVALGVGPNERIRTSKPGDLDLAWGFAPNGYL